VLDITTPHVMTAINESFKAVGRYQKRPQQLGAVRGGFPSSHPAEASLVVPAEARRRAGNPHLRFED
jgi:hypothetical protein